MRQHHNSLWCVLTASILFLVLALAAMAGAQTDSTKVDTVYVTDTVIVETPDIATWIIAASTGVYTIAFIVTVFYIVKQLKENRLLREATVLKEAYDYIIQTYKFRKIIYSNEKNIKDVQKVDDLKNLEKTLPEVSNAIHEVANCYHFIGFLMKHGLLTNKLAIFEEGGDTILRIYEIIKPVIVQERTKMDKETYKQYLEYLIEEVIEYKRKKRKT